MLKVKIIIYFSKGVISWFMMSRTECNDDKHLLVKSEKV